MERTAGWGAVRMTIDTGEVLVPYEAPSSNGNGPDGSHTSESGGTIRFLTPSELRAQTPETPPWVWAPYFAQGWVTIVAGKPKVGKSTVIFGAIEAMLARADSFLGHPITGGPVVIVTEEGAITALAKLPDNDDVHVLTRENAWPKPSWPELIAAAVAEVKRTGAVLLLIDSFAFWARLADSAEKDAGAVGLAFEPLIEAAAQEIAVGLIHHQRKAPGEGGDAIRGSGGIAANCDVILEVERLDEDAPSNQRRLVAMSRLPTPGVLVYDHDPRERSWRVVGETVSRAESQSVSWHERILNALPNASPGATYDDIQGRVGTDKRKWFPTLTKLRERGEVCQSGKGHKGDPFRYWRAPKNSVPAFRTDAGTETDGISQEDPISIPSYPVGGRNEIGPITETVSIPSQANGTESPNAVEEMDRRESAPDLREPACKDLDHRLSDWAREGAEAWTCGVCHPPASGLRGKHRRVQQCSNCEKRFAGAENKKAWRSHVEDGRIVGFLCVYCQGAALASSGEMDP
jgi:hypothetical protein